MDSPEGAPASAEAVRDDGSLVLADVSNAMVRLYKELFGRGPTKARSYWAGRDILVCILRETLTPAERQLASLGENQRLRETRMFFQHAAEERFRSEVEAITGRRVMAFMSGMDVPYDAAAELFILEPRQGPAFPDDGD